MYNLMEKFHFFPSRKSFVSLIRFINEYGLFTIIQSSISFVQFIDTSKFIDIHKVMVCWCSHLSPLFGLSIIEVLFTAMYWFTVKPRSKGFTFNGFPPITDAYSWSFQSDFFCFLCRGVYSWVAFDFSPPPAFDFLPRDASRHVAYLYLWFSSP